MSDDQQQPFKKQPPMKLPFNENEFRANMSPTNADQTLDLQFDKGSPKAKQFMFSQGLDGQKMSKNIGVLGGGMSDQNMTSSQSAYNSEANNITKIGTSDNFRISNNRIGDQSNFLASAEVKDLFESNANPKSSALTQQQENFSQRMIQGGKGNREEEKVSERNHQSRGSFNGQPKQQKQMGGGHHRHNSDMSESMQFKARNVPQPTTPNNQMGQKFTKLIDDGQIQKYQTQLSINKPFASNDFAQHFSVCNPRKSQNGDHIIYNVYGEDSIGKYEIQRRYKEFYLLRQSLSQRYPGLYVPPVPPKRSTGNTNTEFVEARCFYLNMFYKQLVRCPYLFESEELQLFARPNVNSDVERSLTYLPKLSPMKLLDKIMPFYSIMGEISNSMLTPLNLQINEFMIQCRRNLKFLEQFKEQVAKMEVGFDSTWGSNTKLNNFFFDYEKDCLQDYLLSLNHQNKKQIKGLVQASDQSMSMSADLTQGDIVDSDQYILFENENKRHLKTELEELPKTMENPYQILRRFINWEMMDLEAMIETIANKGIIEKKKNQTFKDKQNHAKQLSQLQKGKGISSTFSSKSSKINKITELNDKIEIEEKEIECAECLTKIVYLYLHEAAIPFFRLDKLGVYNGAINLYAQKQINNCNRISDFYSRVIGLNQVEIGGHIGNVTILDERSYYQQQRPGQEGNDESLQSGKDQSKDKVREQNQQSFN